MTSAHVEQRRESNHQERGLTEAPEFDAGIVKIIAFANTLKTHSRARDPKWIGALSDVQFSQLQNAFGGVLVEPNSSQQERYDKYQELKADAEQKIEDLQTAFTSRKITPAKRVKLAVAAFKALAKQREFISSGERKFGGREKAIAAKRIFKLTEEASEKEGSIVTKREKAAIGALYKTQLENYLANCTGKIGFSNIRVHRGEKGTEIEADVHRVSYPAYSSLATRETPKELIPSTAASGLAVTMVTSDGYIPLQHRGTLNDPYGDIPGAGIAGMMDASRNGDPDKGERAHGGPDPLTIQSIFDFISHESVEEIGLPNDMLDKFQFHFTGLAMDEVKTHWELLAFSRTFLSKADMQAQARENLKKKSTEHDFAEPVFFIPADPESIKFFLTQVRCPMPPTHVASLVAAGRHLVRESTSEEAAQIWAQNVEEGIRENYQAIDDLVKAHHEIPKNLLRAQTGPAKRVKNFENFRERVLSGAVDIESIQGELTFEKEWQAAYEARVRELAADLSSPEPGSHTEELFEYQVVRAAILKGILKERNPHAWEPHLFPADQGIPELAAAMNDRGIGHMYKD